MLLLLWMNERDLSIVRVSDLLLLRTDMCIISDHVDSLERHENAPVFLTLLLVSKAMMSCRPCVQALSERAIGTNAFL